MFNRFSRFVRHRRRLPSAITEEACYLQRAHGERALEVVLDKLKRPGLTTWGRRLYSGVAKELQSSRESGESRLGSEHTSLD